MKTFSQKVFSLIVPTRIGPTRVQINRREGSIASVKQVTVESIREKLAGYNKTQGRARFILPQDLSYLSEGVINYE